MKQTACRFILIFLILMTVGCAGGGLTTREKGRGSALSAARPSEVSSVQRWAIPGQARPSGVHLA